MHSDVESIGDGGHAYEMMDQSGSDHLSMMPEEREKSSSRSASSNDQWHPIRPQWERVERTLPDDGQSQSHDMNSCLETRPERDSGMGFLKPHIDSQVTQHHMDSRGQTSIKAKDPSGIQRQNLVSTSATEMEDSDAESQAPRASLKHRPKQHPKPSSHASLPNLVWHSYPRKQTRLIHLPQPVCEWLSRNCQEGIRILKKTTGVNSIIVESLGNKKEGKDGQVAVKGSYERVSKMLRVFQGLVRDPQMSIQEAVVIAKQPS